jgi:hypothetical protein
MVQTDDDSPECLWQKMTHENQLNLRAELLATLQKELDPKIIKQLCNAISELAGTILEEEKEWNELDALVQSYIMSNNDALRETGFRILNTLFAFNCEKYMAHKDQLISVLQKGYIGSNLTVRTILSECICTLTTVIQASHVKYISPFLKPIVQTLEQALKEGNEDSVIILLFLINLDA